MGNLICSNCGLPLKKSETTTGDSDQCEICRRYQTKWSAYNFSDAEKEFYKIIDFYKSKNNAYDCIVPVSGGKDSSYVLHFLKNVMKLNTLAVNYDNGFQSIEAYQNLKNIIERTGSAYISYKLPWDKLKMLYHTYTRQSGGDICGTCNMGVSHTVYKWADVEKVPLIIWGYSPIHENTPIYEGKRYCREKMYRNALKGTDSEQYSEIITYDHFKRKNKFLSLYFFNYFRYDETRIIQTLENEYNWSPAKHGSNKADCEIFNVSNYFKIKQNGYGRINIKYSALVRDRQIPLQEALKMISSKETGEEPEDINDVLGKISLTKEYLQGCHSRRLDFVEKFDFNKEFLQLENFKGNSNQKAEILINIIRPEIVRDGGTIEFCGINDGFLMFKLGGDCVGCFLQQVETNYIDTLITRYIPELKGSFPVYDLI